MKSTSPPGAFVVYHGTHGDSGAHRADVILPGAAYTGKVRHLCEYRRPRADGQARAVSRPARRARTGRSSARCPIPLTTAALDTLGAAAPRDVHGASASCAASTRSHRAMRRTFASWRRSAARPTRRLPTRRRGFLFDQSHRARLAVMAECSALLHGARADGGGVRAMTFAESGPLISGRSSSSWRKACCCWCRCSSSSPICFWPTARSGRRCRCGAGPMWSGPFGLLQSFADLLKFVFKEVDHSGRRQQGRLPHRAAGHRRAGARRLGGDPARSTAG